MRSARAGDAPTGAPAASARGRPSTMTTSASRSSAATRFATARAVAVLSPGPTGVGASGWPAASPPSVAKNSASAMDPSSRVAGFSSATRRPAWRPATANAAHRAVAPAPGRWPETYNVPKLMLRRGWGATPEYTSPAFTSGGVPLANIVWCCRLLCSSQGPPWRSDRADAVSQTLRNGTGPSVTKPPGEARFRCLGLSSRS